MPQSSPMVPKCHYHLAMRHPATNLIVSRKTRWSFVAGMLRPEQALRWSKQQTLQTAIEGANTIGFSRPKLLWRGKRIGLIVSQFQRPDSVANAFGELTKSHIIVAKVSRVDRDTVLDNSSLFHYTRTMPGKRFKKKTFKRTCSPLLHRKWIS